jgi:circadian clock protein KaiC
VSDGSRSILPPKPSPSLKSTGIPGLDVLLKGGLPADRIYLVEGDPGTGKTTLALQFLLAGRDRGESCLYVTLSESGDELHDVAASHGLSLEGVHLYQLTTPRESTADTYTLYHPAEIELGEMMQNVLEMTERTQPSRVVFDSLSEVRLLARDSLRYRRQVLALKEFFSGRACTVLLLDDKTAGDHYLQLQSLSHGVIELDQQAADFGRSRRRVRVVKLRGVAAVDGYHDLRIRRGGVSVFPQLVPASGVRGPVSGPVTSGIAKLDSILGGGLTWGTCTLFIGPAGVGKSTLAAQYIQATADQTRAAVFLFDERVETYVARADTLGMDLSGRLASGRITIDQIEPGELSPGEFSHRVCAHVEAGAKLVIIDSLNGYLNAISNSHSPLVRLYELLSFLNECGVLTLVLSAQHGIIGTTMNAPIDVSYLADCVVLLRYFEAGGSVRKALSVMKKRTGRHETSIREFGIEDNRIRVGDPLVEFQGILTGVPTYVGAGAPLLRNEHSRD